MQRDVLYVVYGVGSRKGCHSVGKEVVSGENVGVGDEAPAPHVPQQEG